MEIIAWTGIIVLVRLILRWFVIEPLKSEEAREQSVNNMIFVFVVWLLVFVPSSDANLWLMGLSLAAIWSLVLWSAAVVPMINWWRDRRRNKRPRDEVTLEPFELID